MNTQYKRAAFVFRRDLRLEDNLGLLAALAASSEVIPLFIFNDAQIDPAKNPYFSAPAFSFMLASLRELGGALEKRGAHLYIAHGPPAEILDSLIAQDGVDAVFVNRDYTPFARKRDTAIAAVCKKRKVHFSHHHDTALAPLEDIVTNEGKRYTVFTPFMKKAMEHTVPAPQKNKHTNYFAGKLKTRTVNLDTFAHTPNEKQILTGGRAEALTILHKPVFLKGYADGRNYPANENGTSRLSVHHKFGTISIRETYQMAVEEAGKGSQFVSELYWRDFYYYIGLHFPHVFTGPFLPWGKHIAWSTNKNHFEKWCRGETGIPIVDAGMRQLNTVGWMHNRARMIVASYLTKNLLINWQWGEQYFATRLIDYDPSQNNGGWQWSASTGADPRPLRIFNPYIQAQKFDPNAAYIQAWVPELRDVDPKLLAGGKAIDFSVHAKYPAPLVDQKESYRRALEAYARAKKASK